MTVGLLTSINGKKVYGNDYKRILEYLSKKGFNVVHVLDVNIEEKSDEIVQAQNEKELSNHYKKLKGCDLIIAECSHPSISVGYGVALLLQIGKPLVILYKKDSEGFEIGISALVSEKQDTVSISEYDDDNVSKVLEYSIATIDQHVDRRFTIIFPPQLMNQLQKMAQSKKVAKAVFIRQLIEKELLKLT